MQSKMLRRYWFLFGGEPTDLRYFSQGCGVTAYNYEDAIHLLKEYAFKDQTLPEIKSAMEDFDVSTIEDKHIWPNIGVTVQRGVWHPNLTN